MTRSKLQLPRSNAATSVDVARAAGVSRSAVSRTFTEGASVAPETRARVLEAARLLRYRPNEVARSLITGQTKIVAIAISHLDNQFYPSLVERATEALGDAGFRVILYITRGDHDHEPLLDELLRHGVDGLILGSHGATTLLVEQCRAEKLPLVMINNAHDGANAPCVVGDNRCGGATIADFLLASDHKCFAFLAGLPGVSSSEERFCGFSEVIERSGRDLLPQIRGDFDYETSRRAVTSLLEQAQRPDALFCANDHMAFAALEAAEKLDMRPGKDVSIVGFDNVTIGSWPSISLTTYEQSSIKIAEIAVEVLIAQISDHKYEMRNVVLGSLIVRKSARTAGQW